jgi:hypothetical protein
MSLRVRTRAGFSWTHCVCHLSTYFFNPFKVFRIFSSYFYMSYVLYP